MKVLLQRSGPASVCVDKQIVGAIDSGLVLLVGIEKHDGPENLKKMAEKVLNYRVFSDADDKMNLNVQQINGGLLVISQFTLAAETKKGLRPGFSSAAAPAQAKQLFDEFLQHLKQSSCQVETGKFGADMKVQLLNDGPVTFLLEN
ncbi:D-aminoacyl-tRNA deacylase [Agaribacterium haliotis]|uniref:D-aminoacyl-tRNA deacylase n=1 Tax=Agaribacterium haliotis TaxID=2013869 RepID=UPI000BB5714E|nr:D-aminoacyl-tRNA deacylase [Agaribacterium haliotis]